MMTEYEETMTGHNTLMQGAYLLVAEANKFMSNPVSERLERELEIYGIIPNESGDC